MKNPIIEIMEKFNEMDILSLGDEELMADAGALDNLFCIWGLGYGYRSPQLENDITSGYANLRREYEVIKYAREYPSFEQECGM